jgi:hypothetical protein
MAINKVTRGRKKHSRKTVVGGITAIRKPFFLIDLNTKKTNPKDNIGMRMAD